MIQIDYYSAGKGLSIEVQEGGIHVVMPDGERKDLGLIEGKIIDLLMQMGESTRHDLDAGLTVRLGRIPTEVEMDHALGSLVDQGIARHELKQPKLNIPYPLEHTCKLCGCSCMAQLVGPLSDDEHRCIMEARASLSSQGLIAADVNPIMKGLKPDGSCLHFLNFPGKRCVFLGDDNLCHIHGKIGPMQKPAACRRFPLIGIRTESEIRIGIKPYCYNNMESCDLEPTSPGYEQAYRSVHGEFLADLVENASFRPAVRVPDREESVQARLQEIEILSLLQKPISFASLLASLIHGTHRDIAELPKPFIQDVQRAFDAIRGPLGLEIGKLGQTVHARHAAAFCWLLKDPLRDFSGLEPGSRFGKYVRYALYQLVFLRETSRFPAVSLGLFAYALGALYAAQDLERASDHLTAWMRIMSQTQVFTMLFPSAQAMASLTKNL